MKFGKSYLETLNGPRIPAEWRQTAIEYRKLKKVINRVASELAELGLTSDVLKDLLESRPTTPEVPLDREAYPPAGPSRLRDDDDKDAASVHVSAAESIRDPDSPRIGREIDWDTSDEDQANPNGSGVKGKGKRRVSRRRRATASYELGGTTKQPEPRIRLTFESASSGETLSSDSDSGHPLFNHQSSENSSSAAEAPRFTEVASSEEDAATRDEDDDSSSQVTQELAATFEGAGPKENALLKRVYGLDVDSDDERDWSSMRVDVEKGEAIGRRKSDDTVRWEDLDEEGKKEVVARAEREASRSHALAEGEHEAAKQAEAVAENEADDEGTNSPRMKSKHHRPRRHRKEVFIPLTSETEFLTLLAKALDSLAALQLAQKQQFAQAVQLLAREVSNVSSPSRPKTDLYVWREIFALWVEAQIFESEREKDRGERSVDDAEAKLDWFVNQIAKRKLGKKMKHKESRIALEKFIGLNVQLLDMKRFQLANEEAARKILKKHDKRTALTASLGFPAFIAAASTLSTRAGMMPDGTPSPAARVLILPGFPSLPHMLLSTITSTLLPIIPQLEDYECSICGDVAFKPIRLDCGHKFCVRCLVKMQKRGQDACPQCRKPVVLRANARNLDMAAQQYLELWFPKEVKEKEKLNHAEAAKEELQAMGLEHKCVIQ